MDRLLTHAISPPSKAATIVCALFIASCGFSLTSCGEDLTQKDATQQKNASQQKETQTETTEKLTKEKASGASEVIPSNSPQHLAPHTVSSSTTTSPAQLKEFRKELETQTQKKLDTLDERIRQNPNDGWSYYERGKYLHKIEGSEFALDDLNSAIEKGCKDFEAYKLRADIHSALNNVPEALADLNRADAIDPDNRQILTQRGLVYFAMEKNDAAIKDFDKAIRGEKCQPNNKYAFSSRAALHLKLKQYDKALADFDSMLEGFPEDDGVRQQRLDLEIATGRFDKALADANQLIKDIPEDATIYKVRGDVYTKLKKSDQAVADYTKAIELEPSFAKAFEARSAVYLAAGKVELALKDRDSVKALKEKQSEKTLPKLME